MSDDGVAYSYANIGAGTVDSRNGAAYLFWNLVDRGSRSFVGKVVGFAASPRIALLHTYANLGVYLEAARDGVGILMWNQLEQTAGALRTMEDASPRDLEDGTQRTLE